MRFELESSGFLQWPSGRGVVVDACVQLNNNIYRRGENYSIGLKPNF